MIFQTTYLFSSSATQQPGILIFTLSKFWHIHSVCLMKKTFIINYYYYICNKIAMISPLLQLHIQKFLIAIFFPFFAHRQVWGVIFICAKITKVEKVIYCELGTKVSSLWYHGWQWWWCSFHNVGFGTQWVVIIINHILTPIIARGGIKQYKSNLTSFLMISKSKERREEIVTTYLKICIIKWL